MVRLRIYKIEGDAAYDEAVKYANEHKTDIAYESRSKRQTIVRQNQGFAYFDLNSNQNTDYGRYRLYG